MEHAYRYSPEMPKKSSGANTYHKNGDAPEIEKKEYFSTPAPAETEGDYKDQAGLGEQGEGELNPGNGNPKSSGEAATSKPGAGPRTHKSRLTG